MCLAGGAAAVFHVTGFNSTDLPRPKAMEHYESLLLRDGGREDGMTKILD